MKKLILITNYVNIHSLPLCEAFYERLKDDFLVLETSQIDDFRSKMGWINVHKEYIKKYDEHIEDVLDAETVIYGGIIDKHISARIDNGKLTFLCTERPYKIPTDRSNYLKRRLGAYLHFGRYQKDNFWLLTMSAYAYEDMQSFHNFTDHALKWGYFPSFHSYNENVLIRHNEKLELMWSGRMVSWKHPEVIEDIVQYLEQTSIPYHFTVVGNGDSYDELTAKFQNNKYVEFLGYIQNELVLEKMRLTDIFIFSSDRQEGWGVVLNEAMNAGCTVFANNEIGSVPELLKNGENGYIYSTKQELLLLLDKYVRNRNNDNKLGIQAYETIKNEWNPQNAVDRFLDLLDKYKQTGKIEPYAEGILSAAKRFK